MGNPLRVADQRQAALLLEVGLRPVLSLLMQGARTAGEVGTALGLGLNRAHYLVTKLERAGIAHVESVWPRAGRPLKRYSVARRWFIPFEVTGAETLEAALDAQILPRMEQFAHLTTRLMREHGDAWGYWLEHGEDGSTLRMGDATGAVHQLFRGDTPLLSNIGTLHLTREQALRFHDGLLALVEEFQTDATESTTPYSFAVMLVKGEVG